LHALKAVDAMRTPAYKHFKISIPFIDPLGEIHDLLNDHNVSSAMKKLLAKSIMNPNIADLKPVIF
jgi:hypothetical protein